MRCGWHDGDSSTIAGSSDSRLCADASSRAAVAASAAMAAVAVTKVSPPDLPCLVLQQQLQRDASGASVPPQQALARCADDWVVPKRLTSQAPTLLSSACMQAAAARAAARASDVANDMADGLKDAAGGSPLLTRRVPTIRWPPQAGRWLRRRSQAGCSWPEACDIEAHGV